MKLYSYYRSSAAYRVRIALNLKGLTYDYLPVNLLEKEQKSETYMAMNPQGLVPAIATENGDILAQSVAVLEWLEETYPTPPLLPSDALQRARVRSLVNNIACDIHPILNMAVTNYLQRQLAADEGQVFEWYCTWIDRGFHAVEQTLANRSGAFCFGDEATLADCLLVPQVYNAHRFEIPMDAYPNISRVADHCNTLEPFQAAHPSRQPDTPD